MIPGSSKPSPFPSLPPGYTAVKRLGSSPLSEVIQVVDDEGRRLALKILRGSAALDPRIRERWRREAQLLEEIQHPNLVGSHGAIEVEGRPALLLEFIEGETLRDRLRRGPLRWEEAARIGVQVSRALAKLHQAGALHRDVKPHNILLHVKRGAILADLGLVRRAEDPELTRHGAALGSPAYMSPEQSRDPSSVGPEADVYSLGATLHHALSSKPPFGGSGVGEVLHRVLHEEPEPLPEEVPEPLRRVLEVSMAKDPDQRYPGARYLAGDLGRVLLGYPPQLTTRHRARRRIRIGALAAGAIFLGSVGFWWVGSSPLSPAGGELQAAHPAENTEEAGSNPKPSQSTGRFWAWAGPRSEAITDALSAGEIRKAASLADAWTHESLPEGLDPSFSGRHEALAERARGDVRSKAEQLAAQAERVVDRELEILLRLPVSARPGSGAWRQHIEGAWAEAGIPFEQFPPWTGGPDPRVRSDAAGRRLHVSAQTGPQDGGHGKGPVAQTPTPDSGAVPTSVASPDSPPPSPEDAISNAPRPAAGVTDPAAEAARAEAKRLGSRVGDADVAAIGHGLELVWTRPEWGKVWERVVKVDLRRWPIRSWRLEWQLDPGATPPTEVHWLDLLSFHQLGRLTPPYLLVGDKRFEGFGLLTGSRQVLEWKEGIVRLDNLRVGAWEPPSRGWLRIGGGASSPFGLAEIRVRLEPPSARN